MSSAGSVNHREGVKESGVAYIDGMGRGVTWQALKRDAIAGARRFWSRRGGLPRTGGFDFGKAAKKGAK